MQQYLHAVFIRCFSTSTMQGKCVKIGLIFVHWRLAFAIPYYLYSNVHKGAIRVKTGHYSQCVYSDFVCATLPTQEHCCHDNCPSHAIASLNSLTKFATARTSVAIAPAMLPSNRIPSP